MFGLIEILIYWFILWDAQNSCEGDGLRRKIWFVPAGGRRLMRMTMMTSIMSGSWTWGRNFSWPLTLATSCWLKLAAQILSSQSPSPKSSPKSEVLSLESRTWTLLTLLSLLHHHPPTLNFSDTSWGPTTKCYTFLETSHYPQLRSQLRCKNCATLDFVKSSPILNFPKYNNIYSSLGTIIMS